MSMIAYTGPAGPFARPQRPDDEMDDNDAVEHGQNPAEQAPSNPDQRDDPPVTTKRSANKPVTHPQWVLASRPIKPGPRRVLWWVYMTCRLYNLRWIPVPRHVGVYWRRQGENRKWSYGNRKSTRAIIAVVQGKGGCGKTTITTYDSVEDRASTEELVLVIDADSGGGVIAGDRFELNVKGKFTTESLSERIQRDPRITAEELDRRVMWHEPTNIGVVPMNTGADLSAEQMSQLVTALAPLAHSVYVDTTPGFKEVNTPGAVSVANVVMLPATYHVMADRIQLRSTLDHQQYELRSSKKDSVLIQVSGIRWWQYNLRTVYELASEFEVSPEQIILVPYSRWLKGTKPVTYDRLTRTLLHLSPKTRYAKSVAVRRRGEVAERNPLNLPLQGPLAPGTETS